MTDIAVTHDAQQMAAIHAVSFPDPWSADFFASLLRQPGVTALCVGETPMEGFVLVRNAVDEAEILTVAVRPDQRNRGLGRTLVEAALVTLMSQNAALCFLEVAEDNIPALKVYTDAGFITRGRRKDYYQRGAQKVNAILMERRLQPK